MKFIIAILLGNLWIAFCSSLSVGFKATATDSRYQQDAILIIGEFVNRPSSVQINNILQQLKVIKNLYVRLSHDLVEIRLGKRMKTTKNIASIYEAECNDYIAFVQERSFQLTGPSSALQSYLKIYPKSLFYIKSTENLSGTLSLSLNDPVLLDLSEMFPENMELDDKRCESPLLEYDDVYGTGKDLRRGLLNGKNSEKKRRSRLTDCCCTIC